MPDYNPGRRMMLEATPQVVPVLSRPMDTQAPTMVPGITLRPARQMDGPTARTTLAKIIADTKVWVADFPHQVQGEPAVVLGFFHSLLARDRARSDATTLGQPLPTQDPIETASHEMAPESLLLKDLAMSASRVISQYQNTLVAAGLMLSPDDQRNADALCQQIAAYLVAEIGSPGR